MEKRKPGRPRSPLTRIIVSNVNGYHCPECDRWLDRSCFYPSRQDPRGIDTYCRECRKERRRREPKGKRRAYYQSPAGRFQAYRNGARQRGHDWGLSCEEFMSFWRCSCAYCGSEIETIGLDRVDSSKGYLIGNVVSCCATCNRMKHDMGLTEWIAHMKHVITYVKKTYTS